MPDGKTHHLLWKKFRSPAMVASAAMVVPTQMITGSVDTGLIVAASSVVGYLLGDLVTPDWDLVGIDRAEAMAIKSVILIPVVAWTTLYARIMQVLGGHRGFWSHAPLISSFIRLCWISLPLVVLMHFMGWLGHNYIPYFVGVLIGLSLSDTVHAVADFTATSRRKVVNKTRNRRVREPGD
jgi:uncharacterized metal-binding protein